MELTAISLIETRIGQICNYINSMGLHRFTIEEARFISHLRYLQVGFPPFTYDEANIFSGFPRRFGSAISLLVERASFYALTKPEYKSDPVFMDKVFEIGIEIEKQLAIMQSVISGCITVAESDTLFMSIPADWKRNNAFGGEAELSINSFAKAAYCVYNETSDLASQLLALTLDKFE